MLLLGKETDTQDISGEVLVSKDTNELSEEQVREVILSFVGDYEQIPPMYSALKVNGKKLYELAREGKVVERKARPVKILDIEILEMNLPRVRMTVACSKGTYIRTLCHDIGQKLLCGGCMEELIRTKVSCFEIKDSLTLDEIRNKKDEGTLGDILTPIDAMFSECQRMVVGEYNGNPLYGKAVRLLDGEKVLDKSQVRVYDEKGNFIGLYQYSADRGEYSIVKMFYTKA